MDYIFTPWRYHYITTAAGKSPTCLLCDELHNSAGPSFIVHRGQHCFIILNAFPYTSGHVMIVPYEHVDRLDKLPEAAALEMMVLCQRLETALRALYKPDGLNLGMNIGAAAGAGVAGHIHMHVLPRWVGDTSFVTTVSETRVLPEDLQTTWEKLKKQFES
jgi:ATP adenylyltransferase